MRVWYWIFGRQDGKGYLLGKYDSEDEANDMGFKTFKNEPYEVHPLPTADRARATQMLKHKFLEDTGDLPGSMAPVKHGPPSFRPGVAKQL